MPKKRQKRTVGDLVQIQRPSGGVAFGYVLEQPLVAFFDHDATSVPDDPSQLLGEKIAFALWVMDSAVTSGRWKVLGNFPATDALRQLKPWFFKLDPISKKLSRTQDGSREVAAQPGECRELERAAVWDPEHVEERLDDHFAGRPNKWVESLRLA